MTEQTTQTAVEKYDYTKPPKSLGFLQSALAGLRLEDGENLGFSKKQLIACAVNALSRQPKLMECSMMSIVQCLQQAASIGLDPSGILGQAYMVPRGGKACLDIGYQGYVNLMFNSGIVKSVYAVAVFYGEPFEIIEGTSRKILHTPDPDKEYEEKDLRGVYAVAHLMTGDPVTLWVKRSELMKIKAMTKAGTGEGTAWGKWWEEMHKKSAIKRLRKWIPMNAKQQALISTAEVIDNEGYEVVASETGKRRATEENLAALGNLGKNEVKQPHAEPGEPPLGALPTDPPEAQESFIHGGGNG